MIEIKNVSKWYGQFQVLTDCTTEVKKGEVVVVCGPSGSGKSTLIKCVNALEPFQQGEIRVESIPGAGSVFAVHLPYVPPARHSPTGQAGPGPPPGRRPWIRKDRPSRSAPRTCAVGGC